MEQFNLNTIPGKVAPVCNASQYDTGRTIRVNLFEGSQVYTLDGTEVLSVSVRKPDGHIVTEGVTNTSAEYVEIVTTEQMTACAGDNLCELKIEKGGDVIGTLNFILRVELDPLAGGDPSESFVYNLQTQIAAAVADQYDAADVNFDAAPTAGHGVGFAVTSEGVKTALDSKADTSSLAPVATSGDYDDLTNKPNVPEDLNDLSDVAITSPTNGEILVYNNGSWENQANPASTANFAPDYDDTATYNTNDKIIYQSLLYICLEDNVTGPWDNTKWQQISTADYNASNIEYSSGVSVADELTSLASDKQDKYWKRISSSFELTGNATGTWSFTDDLSTSKYTDILFCISLVSYDSGVRSSMTLSRLGFEAYGVFYDYTIGTDRMYFQLSKATNNSFTVSGTNLGGISSRVFVTAYYR